MSMIDPPRPTVPDAVRKCKEAGIRVVMVTGDHPITAKSIAKQVGIISHDTKEDIAEKLGIRIDEVDPHHVRAIVVHGSELLDMNDEDLDEIIDKHSDIVFARTSPQQKLLIVEGFQRRGDIVAVTGDGVNDSPALKKADIGVAMGITGSDVSKEAAAMILLDDNFASIVNGVEEGRIIFDNLKKTIAYVLNASIPQITPIIVTLFFDVPVPLTTILILWGAVGTDMLPAVSLSYERAESDIMKRKPRDPLVDRLINVRLIVYAYLMLGMFEGLSTMFTYFVVMGDFGYSPLSLSNMGCVWDSSDRLILFQGHDGQYRWTTNAARCLALRNAQTACFASYVLCQWGALIVTKTRKLSIFQQGMKNWVLDIGILEETCVVAVLAYVPPFNSIFKTQPISFQHWCPPLAFFIAIVLFDEVRKYLIRRSSKADSRFSLWVYDMTYY